MRLDPTLAAAPNWGSRDPRATRSVDFMAEIEVDAPAPRHIRVALSALVLGILAVVLSVIPGAAFVAFLPALLAGFMGVHGVRSRLDDRWQLIVGLVLAPVAIILSLATILGLTRL